MQTPLPLNPPSTNVPAPLSLPPHQTLELRPNSSGSRFDEKSKTQRPDSTTR